MNLQGQKIVVIGGSSGIGLATARAAEELGAEVVVTGRSPNKLKVAAETLGPKGTATRADASEREQLDELFSRVGQIDHLVLAAGGAAGAGPIAKLDVDDLRTGFEGRFWPQIAALQAGLPHLRPDGSVTFVSAATAGGPYPGSAGLAAINGAIAAMVPALAVELKPARVNAVAPGVVDTPWWQGIPERDRTAMFEQYASAAPVGRVGTAEDVGQAICSLIGNGFITGMVIRVDGGLTLTVAA